VDDADCLWKVSEKMGIIYAAWFFRHLIHLLAVIPSAVRDLQFAPQSALRFGISFAFFVVMLGGFRGL